jgi:replicative DNA helicase
MTELEAVDGLSFLVSLYDGVPQIPNLDPYIRLIKDKAILRRIVFGGSALARCAMRNRRCRHRELPAG